MTKVVFFGSGKFVEPIISALDKNFDLSLVVSPGDVRSPAQLKEITEGANAQIGVVANFGYIIPKSVIETFPKGILNVHPSLLPKYRGPTPAQTAILNADKKTGVTIIKIDELVDHGPILVQKEVEIQPNETTPELLSKLFEIGAKMLPSVLTEYVDGKIKPLEQDHSKATFTHPLVKESSFISLDKPLEKELLNRMIRAYYPWPSVWTRTELGGRKLIVKFLPENRVQVEGRKPVSYKDFINGYAEGKEILSKINLVL